MSYYDSTMQKRICIKFQQSGYCPQHMTCKFLHRYKQQRNQQLNKGNPFIPKSPKIIQTNKLNCENCNLRFEESHLFCNSFCGHLFCYECTEKLNQCKTCTINIDKQIARQYFKTYCKRCKMQNIAKAFEKLCKKCKQQQESKINIKQGQSFLLEYKNETLKDSLLCIICMNKKKEYCVFPCSHMMYCVQCMEHVKKSGMCFFCNGQAEKIEQIFY